MKEANFSQPAKLADLETVINIRTPVYDIERYGDIRIKLDTDVNDKEWYVIEDDSGGCEPIGGVVSCWAFPHFNGGHDFYRYIPVAFCFKTLAALLAAYPTELPIWGYDKGEYAERLERQQPHQSLQNRMQLWGLSIVKDEDNRPL
jgi:hypothetical protein